MSGYRTFGNDVRKVWESPLVVKTHVHAAVEHNIFPTHGNKNTAPADILPCTEGRYFDVWHFYEMLEKKFTEFV